jgi:hypothetical protein
MKKNLTILGIFTVLTSAAPALAIWVPQNRTEFVKAVEDGKGATTIDRLSRDQPLDKVYALLEEKVGECLDVKVTRTANVGYVERSSTDYNPTLQRTGRDRAEFTLQLEHNPRGVGHTPPNGGLYFMAADLRAVDANHTEVILYRSSIGAKKIVASLKQWLDGDPAPCPKLR